jgi:predicted DNA binding CopG/RHH family protein
MKKNYDFSRMKWIANPYAKKLKKSITLRVDQDVIEYFQKLAARQGLPYQTLLNLFLRSCKEDNLEPKLTWQTLRRA